MVSLLESTMHDASIRRCSSPEVDTCRCDKSSSPDFSILRRRTRSIRFNRTTYIQETTHVNDMTDDEVSAVWYCNREIADMKKEYSETLRIMATCNGIDNTNESHCTRGLEYRTRDGARRRQMNKLNALHSVLEEQERQRILGVDDDVALAYVYIEMSSHCADAALSLGLEDMQVVRDIINEESLEQERPKPVKKSSRLKEQSPRSPPGRRHSNSPLSSTSVDTSSESRTKNGLRRFFQKSQSDKPINNDVVSVSS